MNLVAFKPSAVGRVIALSEEERELILLFRAARQKDAVLNNARHVVERERPRYGEIWMDIDRLRGRRIADGDGRRISDLAL